MDKVLTWREEAPFLHREVARDLHHPRVIGVRRHSGDVHFPRAEADKE
jgi:hypothetical protein